MGKSLDFVILLSPSASFMALGTAEVSGVCFVARCHSVMKLGNKIMPDFAIHWCNHRIAHVSGRLLLPFFGTLCAGTFSLASTSKHPSFSFLISLIKTYNTPKFTTPETTAYQTTETELIRTCPAPICFLPLLYYKLQAGTFLFSIHLADIETMVSDHSWSSLVLLIIIRGRGEGKNRSKLLFCQPAQRLQETAVGFIAVPNKV